MQLSPTPEVSFFYEAPVNLRDRNKLKSFIRSIFTREKTGLSSLNYIFCTDKRVLEINKQFLQHNYYTDIITFELSAPGLPVEAEIYISVERVKDNASQLGVTFTRELHRVIFHGVLHLCGYKDKSPEEERQMREKEDTYLMRYFGK